MATQTIEPARVRTPAATSGVVAWLGTATCLSPLGPTPSATSQNLMLLAGRCCPYG
jgi:hypothetical protein